MKIWILLSVENLPENDNPVDPWNSRGDKKFGFVIRAETEEKARNFAHKVSGNGNRSPRQLWLDSKYTSCNVITNKGQPGILMIDFNGVI